MNWIFFMTGGVVVLVVITAVFCKLSGDLADPLYFSQTDFLFLPDWLALDTWPHFLAFTLSPAFKLFSKTKQKNTCQKFLKCRNDTLGNLLKLCTYFLN